MFRVNRQTDYAVRILLALARRPEGTRLSTAAIQEEMLIPPALAGRIVARLASAGLLHTTPGRDGGLSLARPPAQIHLAHVIEAMEGPLCLSECMLPEAAASPCPFAHHCPVRARWGRIERALLDALEAITFAELAADERALPVTALGERVRV